MGGAFSLCLIFTDDLKKEAVRLAGTSGRTLPQIAKDLGVGFQVYRTGNSNFMMLIF